MPTYSGKIKLDFCKRLGDSWRELADYFDIPPAQRTRFTAGEEARGIWEWLAERDKLAALPEALTYIDREDLVVVLEPVSTSTLSQQPVWQGPPYPGLRYFTPDESPIFFGRGLETQELLDRLANSAHRFIAVVGASGSGKSSLVAAGLIPRLGEIPGGKDWLWLRFTPGGLGNDPFLALAAKLEPLLEKRGLSGCDIANKLRASGEFAELAGFILEDKGAAELLLFIAQFEELFTLTAPKYQRRFSAMLGQDGSGPAHTHCADPARGLLSPLCRGSQAGCIVAPGLLSSGGAWTQGTPGDDHRTGGPGRAQVRGGTSRAHPGGHRPGAGRPGADGLCVG